MTVSPCRAERFTTASSTTSQPAPPMIFVAAPVYRSLRAAITESPTITTRRTVAGAAALAAPAGGVPGLAVSGGAAATGAVVVVTGAAVVVVDAGNVVVGAGGVRGATNVAKAGSVVVVPPTARSGAVGTLERQEAALHVPTPARARTPTATVPNRQRRAMVRGGSADGHGRAPIPPARRAVARWPVSLKLRRMAPRLVTSMRVIEAWSRWDRHDDSGPAPSTHATAALIGDTWLTTTMF